MASFSPLNDLRPLNSTLVVMFSHVDSQAVAVGVIAFLLVLDILAVLSRLYVKRSLKQQLRVHDWLILLALVSIKIDENKSSLV